VVRQFHLDGSATILHYAFPKGIVKKDIHSKAVKAAFDKDEWAMLEKHKEFMHLYEACCNSLEDVEKICTMGHEIVLESKSWIKKIR
jgi:hypothetical protein